MRKKKSKWVGICLVCFMLMAAVQFYRREEHATRLEIVEVATGQYGYKIFRNERLVVYQPFIPALSGKKAFSTPEDAGKVGEMVLERFRSGDNLSVSIDDLNKLGIGK